MDLDKVEQLEGKITSELDGLKQKIDNMTTVCKLSAPSFMSKMIHSQVVVSTSLFVVLYLFGQCRLKFLVTAPTSVSLIQFTYISFIH